MKLNRFMVRSVIIWIFYSTIFFSQYRHMNYTVEFNRQPLRRPLTQTFLQQLAFICYGSISAFSIWSKCQTKDESQPRKSFLRKADARQKELSFLNPKRLLDDPPSPSSAAGCSARDGSWLPSLCRCSHGVCLLRVRDNREAFIPTLKSVIHSHFKKC